jgi:hypothetical protein
MPKATIEAFKTAFNKPIAPITAVGGKLAIDKENKKSDGGDFRVKAAKLYKDNPKYFKKLLAYKMAKHWDDPSRHNWINQTPAEAVEEVVGGLVGDKPTAEGMKLAVEQLFDCTAGIAKLIKTDVDLFLKTVKENYKSLDPKKAKMLGTCIAAPTSYRLLKEVFESGDKELTGAFVSSLQDMPQDDVVKMAETNPAFFMKEVLKPFNGMSNRGVDLLSDPKMRAALAKDDAAWKKFVEATPMLKLMDTIEKKFTPQQTKAEKVDVVFQSLVKNDGIELTYFTNRLDEDRAILTGMTDKDQERRDEMTKLGTTFPEVPATQCHNLVAVMTRTVKAVLGDDVKITTGFIKGMALTKKLSTLPGGLLPKTFKGNVVDDEGKPTGQVLFTGNEFGEQSHTWPIIDGEAFDPVLGTKGAAVAAAVDNEFTWIVPNTTGKGKGGWFFVPDKTLKCEANPHGFNTMYRLTKEPVQYEQGIFGITLNPGPDNDRLKVNDTAGLANGKLYIGDVILEIDGVSTKGCDTSAEARKAHNLGEIGATKTLKIRRTEPGKKPKEVKVTITAFAPSTLT